MLTIRYKENNPELSYTLNLLLKEFLGLDYKFQKDTSEQEQIKITQDGCKSSLTLNTNFFISSNDDWLTQQSMPKMPLKHWNTKELGLNINLVNSKVPVIYGYSGHTTDNKKNNTRLNLDIFGSAFFLLSRYEEAITLKRDKHNRFPAKASIAYKAKFLDRPLVDEYTEILWAVMKKIWPNLKRKKRVAKTLISCDVDAPYSPATKHWNIAVKLIVGDLLKRKSIKLAIKTLLNAIASRLGNYSFEYYDTFDWIMDINEKNGNKVTFFFISDHSGGKIDGDYSLKEPRIQALIQKIHHRGHKIGLHGSYNTYKDAKQITTETNILRHTIKTLNIKQNKMGCRQHFLRWKTPDTAIHLNNAGFDYDTSLSFADLPGFRCGTSHEYKMYDLNKRKALNLKQRPLVVMECSIIDNHYMGLGYTQKAKNEFLKYKHRCQQFNGNFTLLWHNSHFLTEKDKIFYKELIK